MDIRKMGFVIFGIVLLATVAADFKIITMWQLLVISVMSMILMMIIVTVFIYRLQKMIKMGMITQNFPEVKVIIQKAHIDNKLIHANSDILKKNIVPTNPFSRCIFRISMEINESIEQLGISAIRLRDSQIIENMIKKKFVARETYIIDTVVSPDETLNFKFDQDIDVKKFLIEELYIP